MYKTLFIALSLTALTGCNSVATPHYDQKFGNAVREANASMVVNPDAGKQGNTVTGMDGKSAAYAAERYQNTFKTPPPVTNVVNIGGGGSK